VGIPTGTVTFLFTDIEGSTRLWEDGPHEMPAALARHDTILRDAIAASGGYVFSTGGDGLGVAFSRAQDALTAAVAAQHDLGAQQWPDLARVAVRMGLHTGEAVERDGDYFGPAVIRAARLMSLVGGGRIVCSLATEQILRPHLPAPLELVPVGTVRLKGVTLPEQVFAVRGPGLVEDGTPIEPASAMARPTPRSLSRLVGRTTEVDEILGLAMRSRLVTLTGLGGVGKTRLALAAAEAAEAKFPDGVAWVELSAVADPGDVAQAVADVLGVSPQPGQALIDTMCKALCGRRLLVVLDNCEHVRAGVHDVVAAVGAQCRDVAVLATSRERLGVDGERVVAVAPLGTDGLDSPAVELLLARLDDPHPDLDGADTAALIDIAQRLDGLPLALELAAARCRTLGIAEVATRLGAEFRVLTDRSRRVERHQTLDAAMAWSYHLLGENERTVLQRLSVFSGPFTLDGAERIAAGGGLDGLDVDDAVSSLVDKSLLERDGHRFRLLATTREFARRRLSESGLVCSAEQAHAEFVVDRIRLVHDGLQGRDEAEWVSTLDVEWPDVRSAIRRAFDVGDADTVIAIVTHLWMEFLFRRPDAFAWVSDAVSRWGERPGPHRHELLAAGAVAAFVGADVSAAVQLAEQALAADPAPGTALDCAPESAAIGAYNFSGRFVDAAAVETRALESLAAGPDRFNEALTAASRALTLIMGGASTEAIDASEESARLAIATGNPSAIAYALGIRAAALASSDAAVAAVLLERARVEAAVVRNQWELVQTSTAAFGAGTAGRSADDLSLCLEAVDDLQRTGWTVHAWVLAWGATVQLFELGRRDEAALLLGACEASGVTKIATQVLPSELEAVASGHGDPRLTTRAAVGAQMPLPELIRIAAGQQPLPPLT